LRSHRFRRPKPAPASPWGHQSECSTDPFCRSAALNFKSSRSRRRADARSIVSPHPALLFRGVHARVLRKAGPLPFFGPLHQTSFHQIQLAPPCKQSHGHKNIAAIKKRTPQPGDATYARHRAEALVNGNGNCRCEEPRTYQRGPRQTRCHPEEAKPVLSVAKEGPPYLLENSNTGVLRCARDDNNGRFSARSLDLGDGKAADATVASALL